jgi:outer membrane lipoprotein SlyB
MKTTLKATLAAAVIAAVSVLQAPAANAVVTGSAYFVPEANAQNAVIGSPALTAANLVATFSVPNGPINFDSAVGGYTLGGFLASSPGEITLTGTAANLAAPLDVGGVRGTMIEIKGLVSVVNGQTFTVTHDDGLQLQIGALLVVNTPGPSSPTVTTVTYTGPTGTFAFDLVYG